jgi:hypothetical protein
MMKRPAEDVVKAQGKRSGRRVARRAGRARDRKEREIPDERDPAEAEDQLRRRTRADRLPQKPAHLIVQRRLAHAVSGGELLRHLHGARFVEAEGA